MKAGVFYKPNDIRFEEVGVKEPDCHEVLIKVAACGICGTDIHIFNGGEGSAPVKPPIILGHEFSGEIIKAGSDVKSFKPGDHVSVDPNIYCGVCQYCRTGHKELCDDLRAVGINFNGGFAEFCAVDEKQLYKIPDDMDYNIGAMMEPVACCIHGVDIASVKTGDKALVIGGGAIGLIIMQLLKLSGAWVALSEPLNIRRDLALKLGADMVINPHDEDVMEQLNDKGIKGADIVFECVGTAKTSKQAIDAANKGGHVVIFGVSGVEEEINIKPFEIYKKQLKISGSFINPDTNLRAVRLLSDKKIDVKPLISHRYKIEDVKSAFENNDNTKIKTMFVFD